MALRAPPFGNEPTAFPNPLVVLAGVRLFQVLGGYVAIGFAVLSAIDLLVAYEQRGNTRDAMVHLTRLTELWRDADPVLVPRVQAARRRLELLAARGG